MSDLISAQESVTKIVDTAIRQILSGEQKLTKEYERSVKDAVDVILDTARREAQADIVRCKDCDFWGGRQSRMYCYEMYFDQDDPEFYCGYAKRKIDG